MHANFCNVINYSNLKEYGVSNLKLQKLLYFIQAYYVSSSHIAEPCFCEKIEAWDFGPVVPVAYMEYKHFGSGDIPTIHSYLERTGDKAWEFKRSIFDDSIIKGKDKEEINSVVDYFSKYSASSLVGITHRQAPWKNAYEPGSNNEITVESLREYFSGK